MWARSPPAARGSSIALNHGQSAIESHADPARGQAARQELGGERHAQILRILDDEVLQPALTGEGDDREPAVVEKEADPRGASLSLPDRQEKDRDVQRKAALAALHHRDHATTSRARHHASASTRKTLLPTARPRPPKRPGTLDRACGPAPA